MNKSAISPPKTLRTVANAVEMKAAANGSKPFLYHENRVITYNELNERANAVAHSLRDKGISKGDQIALYLYNREEYLYAYFGIAKIGAVAVPIDTRFDDETLVKALARSDCETIIIDRHTEPTYSKVRNRIPGITLEYFAGHTSPEHPFNDFDSLLEGISSKSPDIEVKGSDTLTIAFVERQAESPRGVMLPQYSYANTGWEIAENLFDISSDDKSITSLPLYSTFTMQVGIMGSLLSDSSLVLLNRFDPDTFWSNVESYGTTVFFYLSRMLSVLYNRKTSEKYYDNSLELAIGHGYGFGKDEKLIEGFGEKFGVTVYEGYGTEQTASIATYNCNSDKQIGSVGRPVSYAEVEVVDENDWVVPRGNTGEIVVRPTKNNTMMKGYYDKPEQTVTDCRNQWIHTGDYGYIDQDGYLFFVAGGENSIYRGRTIGGISAMEIESVINTHPSVQGSAVTGIDTEAEDEEIFAIVVPNDDASIDPVEISKHCDHRLPHIKVPRFIEIRESLPRTPTGKIKTRALEETSTKNAWDREKGYEFIR